MNDFRKGEQPNCTEKEGTRKNSRRRNKCENSLEHSWCQTHHLTKCLTQS